MRFSLPLALSRLAKCPAISLLPLLPCFQAARYSTETWALDATLLTLIEQLTQYAGLQPMCPSQMLDTG